MTTYSKITGRLAPSPTGFLHLGNAWAFFLAWLGARSRAGKLILRMEDIDPIRSRPEYATAIMEDLRWLGLNWDGEVYIQSQRLDLYERAIAGFEARGLVILAIARARNCGNWPPRRIWLCRAGRAAGWVTWARLIPALAAT